MQHNYFNVTDYKSKAMNVDPNVSKLQLERQQTEQLLETQKKRMVSMFSEEMERQFWKDREQRLMTLIQRAIIPGIIAYFVFEVISLPLNYISTEVQYRDHDVLLTMGSYTAGWFALFSIYATAKFPVLSRHYALIVSVVIGISLSIVQIILFSTQALSMTWRGTLIIVFAQMFAFLCSGLRPKHMFVTGMLAGAVTCVALYFLERNIPSWVLFNVIVLGNLVGLGLATLGVSTERIRFLQGIMIEQDKKIYVQLNQHLFKLSQQDTLTGLGNRRNLEYFLSQERFKDTVQDVQYSMALLFIDVDFFKNYNDLYGHQHGDVALMRVAQMLKKLMRPQDLATRYGGEEFVILLDGADRTYAEYIVRHIQKDMAVLNITHADSEIAEYLTLSIGCTVADVNKNIHARDLLELADQALYKAKRQGRNQVVYSMV